MQPAKQNPEPLRRDERIIQLKLRQESENRLWLVTQQPQCASLAEVVNTDGTQSLKNALAIFAQVADAVSVLHGYGFMHGAIVPEVIFVDDSRRCLVGWTDEDQSANPAERFPDWEGFIAPEVRSGAQPDSRSDVYSLGVLLHWLLTRQIPNGSGPSGKIPRDIGHVIERAVDKNAQTRIQTVSGLMDALDQFTDEEIDRFHDELDLAVHSAGFDPRLLWRRHPKKLIATCVLVIAAFFGARWQVNEHRQEIQRKEAEQEAQQQRIAQIGAVQRRNVLAKDLFEKGQYRDAIAEYAEVAEQNVLPELHETALGQIARSYGQLKDYGAEYTAWLRLLRKYPDSTFSGEANERIVWIAGQTVKRYGDLNDITTKQDIILDGLPGDWEGIEPVIVDPKGDNLEGGANSDLTAFYAAVKDGIMYLRFDTAGPPHQGDQFCMALDLNAFAYEDSSQQWDFQIGVARGIPPWIWDLRGARSYNNTKSKRLHGARFAQDQCVEVAVPLAAFGTPTSVGVRVFLNYKGSSRANDACTRKVLLRWERPKGVKKASVEELESPHEEPGPTRKPMRARKQRKRPAATQAPRKAAAAPKESATQPRRKADKQTKPAQSKAEPKSTPKKAESATDKEKPDPPKPAAESDAPKDTKSEK